MLVSKDWLVKADNVALAELPNHLRLFINTPEAFYEAASLPVVIGEEQWLLSTFCEQGGRGWPNDPRTIYSPRVQQWIHFPSGAFRWEEPAPATYGSLTAVQDEFGICMGSIQRGHLIGNEWHEAAMRYSSLLLLVMEQRWLLTAYPTTNEERETARELLACTHIYYDQAMMPYYQHYGRHFLAWMERAAQ